MRSWPGGGPGSDVRLLLHDAVPSTVRTGVSSGPAGWRTGLDRHLADCDGCTAYLQQIRAMIDALARLDEGTVFAPPGPGQRS